MQQRKKKVEPVDPSIYQYDEIYEQLQAEKGPKQQGDADKEKKPKYAQNMVKEGWKRQLGKMLRDERTEEKRRKEEGGAFDDKEVFVTGAYREKVEEVKRYKEELAKQDATDASVTVDIAAKRLEIRERMRGGTGVYRDNVEEVKRYKEESAKQDASDSRRDHRPRRGAVRDDRIGKRTRERGVAIGAEEARHEEKIRNRMLKVCAVLKHRNGEVEIGEMRERYFERVRQGDVIPPIC